MVDTLRRSSKIRDWVRTRAPTEIRNWLQTVVVVAVSGAGIWEFVLKEVIWPEAAPINLTTQVALKEAGFGFAGGDESKEQFEAIEISVTANNPSTRDVYLLGNCWYAKGFVIRAHEGNKDWAAAINQDIIPSVPGKPMAGHARGSGGAYYDVKKSRLVAANAVLADTFLHPNETTSASFVIFVPQNMYDVLHVVVVLPTTAVDNEAAVAWTVIDTDDVTTPGCDARFYRRRNGVLEKIKNFFRGQDSAYEEATEDALVSDSRLKYQVEKSERELSLWQAKPPPAATAKPLGTSPSR